MNLLYIDLFCEALCKRVAELNVRPLKIDA